MFLSYRLMSSYESRRQHANFAVSSMVQQLSARNVLLLARDASDHAKVASSRGGKPQWFCYLKGNKPSIHRLQWTSLSWCENWCKLNWRRFAPQGRTIFWYLLGPIRPVLDLKAFDPVLRPKDGTPEGQLCPWKEHSRSESLRTPTRCLQSPANFANWMRSTCRDANTLAKSNIETKWSRESFGHTFKPAGTIEALFALATRRNWRSSCQPNQRQHRW